LSGRGLCDELITRPQESYRLCCVVVCDLETSRMGAPYTYDISSLKVNNLTLILLTWRKWWAPNNASKWQMGFNSGFKGLKNPQKNKDCLTYILLLYVERPSRPALGPTQPPAFYTLGTRSFPGENRTGRGVDHPPPYSSEVKERVELYLYSTSGPSWPVMGWILPLPLPSVHSVQLGGRRFQNNRERRVEMVPCMAFIRCCILHGSY